MAEMSVQEARAKLGDLVIAAKERGEVTVITRYGAPAALLMPYEDAPEATEKPCLRRSHDGEWTCTAEAGHSGLHVAYGSEGVVRVRFVA